MADLTTRSEGSRGSFSLPFSSLRIRLLFLFVLVLIPSLGISVYNYQKQRAEAITAAQEGVFRLAETILSDRERIIREVRQLLKVLASLPVVRRGDGERCGELMAGVLDQESTDFNLGVIKPSGQVYCSAVPFLDPISVAGQRFFQDALTNRKFSVGEYHIDPITGRSAINFGYPILNRKGSVRGVVYAAVDVTSLNHIGNEALLPQKAVVTLIDRKGIILARFPDPEKWTGKPMMRNTAVRTILAGEQGVLQSQGGDGEPRLFAYTTLQSSDQRGNIRLILSVPEEVVFSAANFILTRDFAGARLLALLGLFVALLTGDRVILKPVRALVGATKQLASGDLSARTGLSSGHGEFRVLARAIDEMAAELQKREQEAEQTEKEIRDAQLQLLRSEKLAAVGMLAAGITHEVQNPLSLLALQVQNLQEGIGTEDPEKLQKTYDKMAAQLDRIIRISRNLLDFSRQREPALKPVDIRKTLDGVADLVEYQYQKENVNLVRDYPQDLPIIRADEDQLRQVFLNLVTNAKDAMPQGGQISLRVRPFERDDSEFVRVAVEDTGTGIPEGFIDRIFEPFFTTKPEGKGTGLGISISSDIVENHGGKLEVRSIEGMGTTFVVDLPVLEEELALSGNGLQGDGHAPQGW
jgi:signal transduction histidine kinase